MPVLAPRIGVLPPAKTKLEAQSIIAGPTRILRASPRRSRGATLVNLRQPGANDSMTREEWLTQAEPSTAAILKERTGLVVPPGYISVGFPKGARSRMRAVGQCFSGALSADRRPHLFVSPTEGDAATVLAIVLHEQIHAAVGPELGHRGEFVRVARAVGFMKPWAGTRPGPELMSRLNTLARKTLGPYPHAALTVAPRKGPGSRLRLWECECGVKVRVASDQFRAMCHDCGEDFERQDD